MIRRTLLATLISGLVACSGDADTPTDTGDDAAARCAGELDDPAVRLGQGVGGAFEEFTGTPVVGLDIAPQGGFGVTVQVDTSGLQGDSPVQVTVDSELDGESSGSFDFVDSSGNPTQQLFCKDDGTSTLGAGIAVGFDPAVWNADNLVDLDGKVATLIVTITDARGVVGVGRTDVQLSVGQ